ncbi:MAG: citrate lyase holo-[Oscillospiraceae bacterium]|nr:citrate lyase holo-[acyl-carrier protein] synthase [Oscillospiraceae bacterium]
MIEREITLTEILIAREDRVAIQNALLEEYHVPVVSFTMNIAGPVKVTGLSHRAFLWGMEQLRLGFLQNKMKVRKEFSRHLPTGDEGYFAVDAPAEAVKALCVELEEASAAGRLYDMDVIGTEGKKLERGSERPCIVCHKPGRECASRRLHSVAELQLYTANLLQAGLWSAAQNRVSALATQALLDEVAVTPKPGLVDRANNGSHRDMDYFTFQASAAALAHYWRGCVGVGFFDRNVSSPNTGNQPVPPAKTFANLRPLGKKAERDMLAATGGVNTHKGAIFTLGVLCGAIGRLWTAEEGFPSVDIILDEAAAMTRETLERELPAARWNTAGEALYQKYGVRGIRGQVADGLPAVREIGLPVFQKLLAEGLDRNHAAAVTLLHLIANVEDTNLLHRGGPEGAKWAREAAGALIGECRDEQCSSGIRNECNLPQANPDDRPTAKDRPSGDCLLRKPDKQCLSLQPDLDARVPSLEEIAELDRMFIERNLSPGGCADLLAVTLFLEALHS